MRILGLFLIVMMAVNVLALGHVDTCHFSGSAQSTISEFKSVNYGSSEAQYPDSTDSDSGHCKIHCFQQPACIKVLADFTFAIFKSEVSKPYSFTYHHLHSESPFRPPLV